jgi:virulence protein sciE type
MIVFDNSRFQEQLQAITNCIKAEPLNASHRMALANLRLLMADYTKALQQMQAACQIEPQWQASAYLAKTLIQAEHLRTAVFNGKIKPDLVLPPPAWLPTIIDALAADYHAAADMRVKALEQAEENPGILNGNQSFEWLADGDSRLGPIFEVIIAGNYYWVPMEQVYEIQFQPIEQPLDLLWRTIKINCHGAQIVERICHMPMRYSVKEGQIPSDQYATQWFEIPGMEDAWTGIGQRVWFTDQTTLPIEQAYSIKFSVNK